MKKLIALLLGILMVVSLAACAGTTTDAPAGTTAGTGGTSNTADTKKADETTGTADSTATSDNAPTAKGKTLVVYFSGSGNTKRVAEYLAEATGADLFALVPVTPYTSVDLSWTTPGSRVNREHDNESLRDIPLTATTLEKFADYDTVFIGYPIWWGIAAWPVNNFVKNNDFTGKTVIPFATSSSSGMGQSGTLLRDMAGNGSWQDGKRFSSSVDQATVENWVKSLQAAS